MNKVVFKLSLKTLFFITVLVAGLLVFVWLHWRGQRQVELIVFSVLAALAVSLYTLQFELRLSVPSREITGTRTWLGVALRKIAVRIGSRDTLFLTEELARGESQGVTVWHQLEASGQLVSDQLDPNRSDKPDRHVLASQPTPRNRAKLAEFAQHAAKSLGVPLEDTRKFTERVK
jgi:Zn-dependent protease with chaperone function